MRATPLEFARLRARTRWQGRYRIARELRARGVSDQHIEAAVAQAFAETDEAALVRKTIERRIRSLRGPLDARRAASLYGSLLRAGFDAGLDSPGIAGGCTGRRGQNG